MVIDIPKHLLQAVVKDSPRPFVLNVENVKHFAASRHSLIGIAHLEQICEAVGVHSLPREVVIVTSEWFEAYAREIRPSMPTMQFNWSAGLPIGRGSECAEDNRRCRIAKRHATEVQYRTEPALEVVKWQGQLAESPGEVHETEHGRNSAGAWKHRLTCKPWRCGASLQVFNCRRLPPAG